MFKLKNELGENSWKKYDANRHKIPIRSDEHTIGAFQI